MKEIKMVNLYRCSDVTGRISERKSDFFVTDYFDSIIVDDINPETRTLAECMGIDRRANEKKKGISHQRYCLCSDEADSIRENIFKKNTELPVLMLIQVFMNADLYQAGSFVSEAGREEAINCDTCMRKLSGYLHSRITNKKFRLKFYRLLTAGDFAVVVRSEDFDTAYGISSLICGVRFGTKKGASISERAFYTYSIAGIPDTAEQDWIPEWGKYLTKEERVSLAAVFELASDNRVDEFDKKMISSLLEQGYRTVGRYDYRMLCTPDEFQSLYGKIRTYKFDRENFWLLDSEITQAPKSVRPFLWMLQKGVISQISEQLLLKGSPDYRMEEQPVWWEIRCSDSWSPLYERNDQMLEETGKLAKEIEASFSACIDPTGNVTSRLCYQNTRNLKEYMRLIGRLKRIIFEINQKQELQIGAANVIEQLYIMLSSMKSYINYLDRGDFSVREKAERVDCYLNMGLDALEIFTKYIRNINLQTVQTPNYDLQTNVCVVKILLAYNQFFFSFFQKKTDAYRYETALYPIIVPNMSTRDMSVSVLFNKKEKQEEPKLMVIFSPTFDYLCETTFLLPTAFHEIAHQFRYEDRRERNKCLKAHVIKDYFGMVVWKAIVPDKGYDWRHMSNIKEIVDRIYDRIEDRILGSDALELDLHSFENALSEAISEFIQLLTKRMGKTYPANLAKKYIEETEGIVSIDEARKSLEEIGAALAPVEKKECTGKTLDWVRIYRSLMKYHQQQVAASVTSILKIVPDAGIEDVSKMDLETFFSVEEQILNKVFSFVEDEMSLDASRRVKLVPWVKKLHHAYFSFRNKNISLTAAIPPKDLKCSKDEITFDTEDMDHLYGRLEAVDEFFELLGNDTADALNQFESVRGERIDRHFPAISSEELQKVKRRLRFEKDYLYKVVDEELSIFSFDEVRAHVSDLVTCYREVTSDLYMCSAMNLNMMGYLVLTAQNIVFNKKNEMATYRRVHTVLQCLAAEQIRQQEEEDYWIEKLDGNFFDRMVIECLRGEINILRNQTGDSLWKTEEFRLQEAKKYVNKLRCKLAARERHADIASVADGKLIRSEAERKQNSSRDWTLRIYLQVFGIVENIQGTIMLCEEPSGGEIWKDLAGTEQSYLRQTSEIRSIVKANGGEEISNLITEVLNSPARFYNERCALLEEEINFIFSHYEQNCRQVFRWE